MTPFIVAEMSANHLGMFGRARQIVKEAADAGADAIKVQVWSADTMVVDPSQTTVWAGKPVSLMDLYREAWTPWEWLPELFAYATRNGLEPFGAAFDRASVDYLCKLHVERLKIASFELVDLPLIRYAASKGLPMILSTGMATLEEVDDACIAAEDVEDVTLLKCTSAYPADASDANLSGLEFVDHPGYSRGLSDHTLGIGVAVAAAALGATYIEKHLTLSRADGGPDAGFSMEPAEFKQMVTECRRATAAIGTPSWGPGPNESTALRRSLWVVKDTRQGDRLTFNDNIASARPALGLSPSFDVSGRCARKDLKAGTPLTEDCIA